MQTADNRLLLQISCRGNFGQPLKGHQQACHRVLYVHTGYHTGMWPNVSGAFANSAVQLQ